MKKVLIFTLISLGFISNTVAGNDKRQVHCAPHIAGLGVLSGDVEDGPRSSKPLKDGAYAYNLNLMGETSQTALEIAQHVLRAVDSNRGDPSHYELMVFRMFDALNIRGDQLVVAYQVVNGEQAQVTTAGVAKLIRTVIDLPKTDPLSLIARVNEAVPGEVARMPSSDHLDQLWFFAHRTGGLPTLWQTVNANAG